MREHEVTALTAAELEATRRELAASLALARLGSPVCAPIQAHLAAIDAELAGRAAARPGLPGSPRARPPDGGHAGRGGRPGTRCWGVLVPGGGSLPGIPGTSGGGRGQMACASGRVPAPSCTWIWSAPSRLSIRATIGCG